MRPAAALALLVLVAQAVSAFHVTPLRRWRANPQRSLHAGMLAAKGMTVLKASPSAVVDEEVQGPSRSAFEAFYVSVVHPGSEITAEQMVKYPVIADMLKKKMVYNEDIDELWRSAVGDAQGLNAQEAYELLCMISDLPEPEDTEFLDAEFKKLVGASATAGGKLPFFKFLNWEDVQDMMTEEALSMEEISQIWRDVAGDLNTPIDRATFSILNNALDDAIDAKEEEGGEGGDDVDLTDVDVWSPDFDPTEVFEPEMLEEITSFFIKSSPRGQLTFSKFLEWEELSDMFSEGLTKEALQRLWTQACSKGKGVSSISSGEPAPSINLDSFIRLNVALDLLLDDLEQQGSSTKSSSSAAASAESFYRSEFRRMVGGGSLLRLDMLLEWKEMAELIDDKVVTEKQIEAMWEGLPKEPMGIPATTVGITENTFVAFNAMLDNMLDVTSSPSGDAVGSSSKAATPSLLVSEPARPMPKQAEMRMGELGDAQSSEATTGLSESELEMMQVLDKADNMLNSGSYGDFDQLIGDINDPRLEALRDKAATADRVKGQLRDVLGELLDLTRKQSRCGLDPPDEETAARIRDLIQAVIEKAPKAASRDITETRNAINGKWHLLYTNSEMFSFYNGVTGFANVFPTSKFADLSTFYSSDGYLSESKYLEKLTTPLGSVDATVFATWEVVKEMSFMTNENSVVVRNYCTKVTAGPMEYLAEENWKSLRTMSMNELVYVDDKVKIMRNSGALRIFFVYERE